jgi:glutathione S-transferase
VARWRKALSARPSVVGAVSADYPDRLLAFFAKRDSIIGRLAQTTFAAHAAAA